MPGFDLQTRGPSRSFPDTSALEAASGRGAPVLILAGAHGIVAAQAERTAILVELDLECLETHLDDASAANVLGFARYRNGDDAPSDLVELVHLSDTTPEARAAARAVLEGLDLTVVDCVDRGGRIVDRLVRPKYNDALRFLDDGLAAAEDMDMTCKMGLGYPDGPIERTVRGGLARHAEICDALFALTGRPGYLPARQAVVARQRKDRT